MTDEDDAVALVTAGGVYLFENNRWFKATALRQGRVGAGAGGWETIIRLLRAPARAQEWVFTSPQGIRPGDIIYVTSATGWAITSEVATAIHGHDLRITTVANIPTGDHLLVMTQKQAFLIGTERDVELLASGFTSSIESLGLDPNELVHLITVRTCTTRTSSDIDSE